MKVIDFINELNRIGFDENTQLDFSCVNAESGEWYDLQPNINPETNTSFYYGEALTGEPYRNDVICFDIDVDQCREYLEDKFDSAIDTLLYTLSDTIKSYKRTIKKNGIK